MKSPMRNTPELWRPFSLPSTRSPFKSLQRQIDQLFDDFNEYDGDIGGQSAFIPRCDVEETDSHYLMSFDLPGVKKQDIHIEVQNGELTVSGERKEKHEEKDRTRTRSERFYGSFSRSFTLPGSIEAEEVEANYTDGVLQIAIPKKEQAGRKQVKIAEGQTTLLDKLRGKKESTKNDSAVGK